MDTSNEVKLIVINTNNIFTGLNQRALEFLLERGNWKGVSDLDKYGYNGNTGLLFVSENDNLEVNNDEVKLGELVGSILNNKIITTIVYDWLPIISEDDGEPKSMPLYKYKLDKPDDDWVYEVEDDLKGEVHPNIKLLCLKDEYNNTLFNWSQKEMEKSELMLEYARS